VPGPPLIYPQETSPGDPGSYALWLIRSFVQALVLLQYNDRFLAGSYKHIQRGIIMIH
jgi:hypothetical protein